MKPISKKNISVTSGADFSRGTLIWEFNRRGIENILVTNRFRLQRKI